MTEAVAQASANPWRVVWLHPGRAVEAVIARDWRMATLGLAASECALALLAAAAGAFHPLDIEPAATRWLAILAVAGVGAALGIAGLYVSGWVVNLAARAMGGRGRAAGVRAAIAWGSIPLLIASIVSLASRLGASPAPAIALALFGVIVAACSLWGVVWQTAMLARVETFGWVRALISGFVGLVAAPFVLASLVRIFAFQPFNSPSSSMAPTLQQGDYFFASKFAYGYSRYALPFAPAWFATRIFAAPPRRGDVVIFVRPGDQTQWVKRIVGLPGDMVQMKGGRLLINGQIVERRRVEPGFKTRGRFGDPIVASTYDEMLPDGATHRIIELEDDHSPFDNTKVFLTPPDAYFVLGDNRDNSLDSRVGTEEGGLGFVPIDNIVGRAATIYYSVDLDAATGAAALRRERIGLAVE